MTGFLLLIALIAAVIGTLEVTNRRAKTLTAPGRDLVNDRDYQRVRGELTAARQVERDATVPVRPAPPSPTTRPSAAPMRPRLAA
jgi:hypothetical protein